MKRLCFICFFGIIFLLPASAFSAGFQTLYSHWLLLDWKKKIENAIPYELENKLLESLTPDEARMVQKVQMVFNVVEDEYEPFCYYVRYSSTPDGSVAKVHFSLTTLRFWRDILLAYAWLECNDYSIETIGMYMGMIKYRMMIDGDTPGKEYIPPLKALGIPDNAFDDKRVGDLYDKLMASSIYFVLAHELGHIRYRHIWNTFEQSRINEAEADMFALEIMRRINIPPMGVANFFFTFAHFVKNRADFMSDELYQRYLMTHTHPLEGNRIIALGNGIIKKSDDFAQIQNDPSRYKFIFKNLGRKIVEIGERLNDPATQLAMTLQGESTYRAMELQGAYTRLQTLAPRKKGESNINAYGIPSENPLYAFNGTYSGKISDPSGSADVELILYQDGSFVRGVFSQGLGVAFIEGKVRGDVLEFDWDWCNSSGKGFLSSVQHGRSLNGKWGLNESQTGRGSWIVSRK